MNCIKIRSSVIILILSIILINFQGCSEDTITSGSDNLEFSYISSSATIEGGDVMILDTVKLLINDIKFNVSNNNQDSVNFKTGPFVLNLGNFSNVNLISSGFISSDNYDKIRFSVHKLNDNEEVPDPDFADANGRYSVIAKGSFNGIRFVYRSSKSAHQKITFPRSLDLSESTISNVTLFVRPYLWFVGSNNLYLDPTNPSNSNDIDNNIKNNINNNFMCYVDNDKNGLPD